MAVVQEVAVRRAVRGLPDRGGVPVLRSVDIGRGQLLAGYAFLLFLTLLMAFASACSGYIIGSTANRTQQD